MTATGSGLEWGDDRLTVQLSAPGAVATVGDDGEAWLTWRVPLAGRAEHEIAWQLTVHDQTAVVMAAPGATGACRDRTVPGRPPGRRHEPGRGIASPAGRPWARVRAESADPRLPRLLARSIDDAAALRMVTARGRPARCSSARALPGT